MPQRIRVEQFLVCPLARTLEEFAAMNSDRGLLVNMDLQIRNKLSIIIRYPICVYFSLEDELQPQRLIPQAHTS